MAKIVSIFFKSPRIKTKYDSSLLNLKRWIKNEFSNSHTLKELENTTTFHSIIGYFEELNLDINHGLLGFAEIGEWKKMGIVPDGNYFIFRKESENLELLSDSTGSRTIWYFSNDEFFAFSSSQFSVIKFLGNFEFNEKVVPWMLSSGTLGPNNSWDKRINFLNRNSLLKYNFDNNNIEIKNIEKQYYSDNTKLPSIESCFKCSFDQVTIESNCTGHLLSGGIESRILLHFIAIPNQLRCYTWTFKEFLKQKDSDVNVAIRLTNKCGLEHHILPLENESLNVNEIFDRFLKYGEGRVDHISGYLDGFKIWSDFQNSRVKNIVRGDHNFGVSKSHSPRMARKTQGCELVNDFKNLNNLLLSDQKDIDIIIEDKNEKNLNYSLRLARNFRKQYVNSALTDLKLAFVEIHNPLLNNKVVEYSEKIQSKILLDKKLTRHLINKYFPDIPFARKTSIGDMNVILSESFKGLICSYLNSVHERDWSRLGLNSVEISKILNDLNNNSNVVNPKSKNWLKEYIPKNIKKFFSKYKKEEVPKIRLLFRIFIIVKVYEKLSTE
ncbi:asparagine synthase-related protein [Belliella sp. DSM 107340]|uniref:asparagine synthase (glutamine-hydrolyzing) n=1 Tax=Belliella calami TaxID=2923436 RepID=A0ABS9UJA9_9BACT|nr:asparagine synthase-related protein [Belliella calami]MCH7396510.1 asparagine synthase-related protein [Belliella calami]